MAGSGVGSFEIVEEIGSTSEALKERAAAGGGEAALMARRQVAGRGRLGRVWATVEGNLHLSVLVRPGGRIRPGHWSLLAAVALADAVLPWVVRGGVPGGLRLKWPNDLLLDGGKLAGILLEAGEDAGPWLVIGFGVNLAGAPQGLGRAVASLDGVVGPEAFAVTLLAALAGWRRRYAAEGFGPIREAWLGLGPALGSSVTAGSVRGGFAGLDEDGALVLSTGMGMGRAVITSGEVS